ncbi:MAG: AIR synthase family protein [Candidatus Methanomethyliaceae archaeon]|nr:AIR synthase family protein [Candidatus Methanomethyliaceae archaeon]
MSRLKVGKIPNEILRRVVFARLGAEDTSVILGPNIGEDAALIRISKDIVAFKSDPITGSVDEVGMLAVYVNANDIATRGAIPKWFIQCILLPEGSSIAVLEKICRQIDEAAKEMGVSIVGGHTEITPGISRPIVIGSMLGIVKNERFFTSGGAEVGDLLYMTKSVGLEGTAILSSDRRIATKFGKAFTSKCKKMLRLINVVKECMVLTTLKGVTSMHDLTEGGLLGGAWELAEAASSGILLDLKLVPVLEETRLICNALGLDPYRLISSGAIIFTVKRGSETKAEAALREAGVRFAKIGEVNQASRGRSYLDLAGIRHTLKPPSSDELWKGLV